MKRGITNWNLPLATLAESITVGNEQAAQPSVLNPSLLDCQFQNFILQQTDSTSSGARKAPITSPNESNPTEKPNRPQPGTPSGRVARLATRAVVAATAIAYPGLLHN